MQRTPDDRSMQRLLWADLIRVVALFAVVLLHAAAVPATRYGELSREWWWTANLLDSFVRPCVPLFVMVSGAMLLDPERSQPLGYFFKRRVSRVVVPLLAWSMIYAGWRVLGRGETIGIRQLGYHLVAGMADPVSIHLWFMYLIVSLYLVTPIFRVWIRHASIENQLYFLELWFFATGLRPLLQDQLGLTIGLSLDPVYGFIGYYVLGCTVRAWLRDARMPGLTVWATAGFSVGFAVTALGTAWLSSKRGTLDESLYSYISPNVMLMSICAFLLIRDWGLRLQTAPSGGRMQRAIAGASTLGLGAYLVHALFLEWLARGTFGFVLDGVAFHSGLAIPVTALVAFAASLACTAALRRVPGVRSIVP